MSGEDQDAVSIGDQSDMDEFAKDNEQFQKRQKLERISVLCSQGLMLQA